MKKSILTLLLMVAMLPLMANANYVQLADGVYQDGTTLYICSDVTSLGDLQLNPSEIYCYATIPPACVSNTFTGYDAILHVPAAGMVSYFTTLYWYNFNNILSDAIEPLSVTMNTADAELEIGQQLSLSATVAPGDATPKTVYWSSTDASVAMVSAGGTVTAVATGECDILATCVDKVAVCHVSVVNPRVTIILDKHEARLLPNHTMTLTATCSPFDVDLAVTSSNPGVAIPRLVNGTIMVVGVAEGTATITVNAADGWGNPDSCVVTVYTEHGDVNCDGYVSIADVTSLIDYLLSGDDSQISTTNADVNKSNNISIADVTTLIDFLLSGKWPWQEDLIFDVNGVSFKMIYVEGGTFTMGGTNEQGNDASNWEFPTHQVTLSDYYIGQIMVTQALWVEVMGSNPSYFTSANGYTDDLRRPVDRISWNDCQEFIFKLNQMTGRQFRLPTEAEWEYAARGGNKSKGYKYAGSNNIDEVGWYYYNIPSQVNGDNGYGTQPVAQKAPNELELYDMSGNEHELCQDRFGSYLSEKQTNPVGPVNGDERVIRGGGWGEHQAAGCRVSNRYSCWPYNQYYGLRLVLDVDNCSKFHLSKTVITVEQGESKTIRIFNGSGNYIEAGGSDNFTCSFNGNELTIMGTATGTNTVYVTDNASGAAAVLTVIVEPQDEHEYVDLGLPTGTLWATCNVGADNPEDYGDYFAWGETTPKDYYHWSTYKWCNGSENTLTKYCYSSNYGYNGFVDNKTELVPNDDAAYANWGSSWRMPSFEQRQELCDNCTAQWTQRNGVNGYLLTGPNGNTLFFPAAGYMVAGTLFSLGSRGTYWLRTFGSYSPNNARYMAFNSSLWGDYGHASRCQGFSVRAVRLSQN